jgi:aminopeptidase YwaD
MTENKRSFLSRRTIVTLIAVLVVIQVGLVIHLVGLLRPGGSPETGEPTVPQFELPVAASTVPPDSTPLGPSVEEEPVVGELVLATGYGRLARMFDVEEAMEHLARLTGEEMDGRQAGTSGGEAAGDYIAAQFADYGLEPVGPDGSYFQTFSVPYGRIVEVPTFAVRRSGSSLFLQNYAYRTDYRALTGGYLGAGQGEGPLLWLNECLEDDYGELDVTGQIVLCRYSGDPVVYRQASEHRVGGLLLVADTEERLLRRPGYRDTAWVPETLPAFMISEGAAEGLLEGTGYTLDEMGLRFAATPLSTTVRMAVAVEEQTEVEARNVLGLLPGSDPEHRDEVVVIGAHYDHLGREPDGVLMPGANDNASGVVTLLEIARLWQAQDFRPARSVLFAAWDAEEIGLVGSRVYAATPLLPLTRTVAVVNLDMVGAGENLRIDGEATGGVGNQLQLSAETFDITTTLAFEGRSDHYSFYEVGVPAATLIWWPDAVYHTPADAIDAIDPEKLRTVGVLSAHTLAALANGHVELQWAVEHLRASIAMGDREAFLAGLDPTDPDLQASQAAWFDDLWSRELTTIRIEPSQMRIGDEEAQIRLTLSYHWADSTRAEPTVSYDVRFTQRDGVWTYAGYEVDTLSGDVLTVGAFEGVAVGTRSLLSTTQEAYLSLAADLGVQPITGTRVMVYPDRNTMRAITRPAAEDAAGWLVSSAGLAEIAWGQVITPPLVNLILNQMGLPLDAAPWLREGLVLHYSGVLDRDTVPTLAAADVITPLMDFPDPAEVPGAEAVALRAYAWSATEYLLDRFGPDGLQRLCAAWGRSGDGDAAFQEALGMSPAQLEAAWRDDYLAPLRADVDAVRDTLAARVEAVLNGDASAFLSTSSTADPILRAEERNWFADLGEPPLLAYSAEGEVVGWSPGADEVVVALSTSTVVSGERTVEATYDARFVREGGRWLYAGVDWDALSSDHFVLKVQGHDRAWAQRVLDRAERIYAQVTTDLGATPPGQLEIKIYDSSEHFRLSIAPSAPDVNDWFAPGESIRLALGDGTDRTIETAIVRGLTRRVLLAQGLDTPWLLAGLADFETGRTLPLGTHWMAGQHLPVVQEAIRRHNELPLYSLPSFDEVPDDQVELLTAQSWSLISSIAEQHGLPGLMRFVDRFRVSDDAANNLRFALGVDPDQFASEWEEYALTLGVPDDLAELAQRFDAERAVTHVAALSGPEFGGRQAGTPGADLAATYVADQFAAAGLQPLGDALTLTATVTGTVERGFMQWFPISHTQVVSVPVFVLLDEDGNTLHEFAYREEFVESVGQGTAFGELVWVRADALEGLSFDGAIVIEGGGGDAAERAAQIEEHGAGGLILVTDREADDLQTTFVPPDLGVEIGIPVYEITGAAFDALVERLGMDSREFVTSPPALPLGVQVRQALVRSPVTTTLTANVLGLLPGSDPARADDVLIVGANYDHIGQAPGGQVFPGANHNASGVATMLEMARVWQRAGYRPARSVLFVAWGAEEVDGAGVEHYLADPVVPLTQTVGVIALDAVGGGRGYRLLFYGTREHDLPLIYQLDAAAMRLERRAWRRGSTGEGWHAAFNEAGIPTLKLIWDDAERGFYLPSDTIDLIELDQLASSGELLTLVAAWLSGR